MTPPEFWLRRLAVIFVCATVIVVCIYVMARLFDVLAPVP